MDKFVKNKNFLVCIDSDGCAMDTMDVKHKKCFGPEMIKSYGLEAYGDCVQKIWEDINLYTITRGINRFLGLKETLKTIEKKGICKIEPYDIFEKWTLTTNELSNESLKREIDKTNNPQLKKALEWSENVNKSITELPETLGAFDGVFEAVEKISEIADICVVSSANKDAISEEWTRCGLTRYVSLLMDQTYGSKAFCIGELLKKGNYDKNKVLMVGDALGDLKAAKENGVCFYPVLVGKEEFSWQRLKDEGVKEFVSGTYKDGYQDMLEKEFYKNLS